MTNALQSEPRWKLAGMLLCVHLAAGCGSGAVSSDSAPNVPLQISPSSVTAYSGVAVTLGVSGGGARVPYQFSSSDPAVFPVPTVGQTSNQLTVTPGNVTSPQPITITARDQAGNSATATATVTPNFVSTDITVTGTSAAATGVANCSSVGAVCVGQSGTAAVTITQAGAPGRGRSIRFDAIQGNFRFPTDVAQTQFATSIVVPADDSGSAVAVVRADAGNSFQVATIRATDVASGAFRISTFFIRQPTVAGAEFSTVPSGWNASGIFKNECGGGSVDFLIFGGTPPYTVRSSAPTTASVTPGTTANENPSRFTLNYSATSCGVDGYSVPITITDARGLTIQSTLTNNPGTEDRPVATPLPTLSLSQGALTLGCGQQAQVVATILNPGTTAPTISASVSTSVSPATALQAVVSTTGGVITLTRTTGTVGPVPNTALTTQASVVIGAGSAGTQSLAITTPPNC